MAKRNAIYSDELYAQVNRENKDLLDDYILEMKSRRKSEKTIYQYTADIKMFYCWAVKNLGNKSILKMKKRDFRRFFLELQDSGTSAARINRVQCSLRNMLEFATEDEDEYDYEINAMRSIKGLQKEEVREIFFLTDEQIRLIVDYLLEKGKYQKALYLTLSYESAGRRNEVYQVKKHGFLENSKTNEVVGKRGKKFKLLYFSKSKEIARLYFDQRGEDDIDSLWVVGKGESKRPATYETLYNWTVSFRSILEELTGEYIAFNPHSFRHSALTNYHDGNHYVLKELGKDKFDLKVLKTLANHTSVETTEGYLPDRDQEILEEAFGI
ncbi:Phage site-specific recombinase (plasmid) [Bacillus subtilis]|uniref:tyrosine-type recombinase/integrase n=1 Tax=Bacillus TaxID=1386 RepID=UPI001B985119|nr:site-specific integrase [Bacillus subtilis]CAF1847292.1 Tyrosine recombinase XerC [Bacillus subtilis]CAF1899644.1 Tyrosine recombinase XerC [Bacillus subtilis]CAI6329569.1 Phage site-specific recombinase [Bacillus subtilis]CAI6330495.1 Phage site-specific recombinase [Bacillus subtilis]